MKKILLAPLVVLGGAFSFLFSYLIGHRTEEEKRWGDNGFGWYGSGEDRMSEAWAMWKAMRTFHWFKNLGQEWYELDSKRAYKFSSFMMVLLFALGLLIGAQL